MSAHTSRVASSIGTARMVRSGIPMTGDAQSTREKDDFYGTPAWVTERLLAKVSFPLNVWEPAAGQGDISSVLSDAGHDVMMSDLVDRGAGAACPVDFLLERRCHASAIITNPPFKLAQEFVEHALNIGVKKIAMLLKLSFAQSKARTPWLIQRTPLSQVLIVPERITFIAARGRPAFTSNFMDAYAWFIWDTSHVGPAEFGSV